jgi:cell division protein ZapE
MNDRITLADVARWLDQPVSASDLLADLTPPKHFADSRFDNYRTDDRFPPQSEAVRRVREFSHTIGRASAFTRFLRTARAPARGLYLDGGFGVGKTHLLASAYHEASGKKSFLSFQELMFLVGLQRLDETVRTLSRSQLVVIDEFELDDPANTRIATNLLRQLLDSGTSILTSSNTPPGALGEGRFSVDSFRREIGDLFDRFETVRVEGEDYRKLHPTRTPGAGWMRVGSEATNTDGLTVGFDELLSLLASAHPIRIRQAMARIPSVRIENLTPIDDHHAALRFVYFVDKLYDDDIQLVVTSREAIDDVFVPALYLGGDTRKYLRCISRLVELTS